MAAGPPVDESNIGETPLVRLPLDVPPTVYAKLEWFNLYEHQYGGGSVKTRIAKAMLDDAEETGELDDDPTIAEPSSGNTGIALARLATSRGHDVEIFLPPRPSETKVMAIEAAGGETTRSSSYEQMREDCADVVLANPREYYQPDQYDNEANPRVHEHQTGREIRDQTDGEVTHFIAGIGTGGTVTGVGRALQDHGVEIIGYEPQRPSHCISGLRYSQAATLEYPSVFDGSVLDRQPTISSASAQQGARWVRERAAEDYVWVHDPGQHDVETVRENLRVAGQFLVGPSSGGVTAALYDEAMRGRFDEDDVVVLMFADRGDRYTSLPEWSKTWAPPSDEKR